MPRHWHPCECFVHAHTTRYLQHRCNHVVPMTAESNFIEFCPVKQTTYPHCRSNSPAEMASSCGVVMCMLADDAAVRKVRARLNGIEPLCNGRQ